MILLSSLFLFNPIRGLMNRPPPDIIPYPPYLTFPTLYQLFHTYFPPYMYFHPLSTPKPYLVLHVLLCFIFYLHLSIWEYKAQAGIASYGYLGWPLVFGGNIPMYIGGNIGTHWRIFFDGIYYTHSARHVTILMMTPSIELNLIK